MIQFDAKKVIAIDANQPLAQVILEVKNEIWKELLMNSAAYPEVENPRC